MDEQMDGQMDGWTDGLDRLDGLDCWSAGRPD